MAIVNDYFVSKLKDKLNIRRELHGLELYTDDDIIKFLDVRETGKYQIVWNRDVSFKNLIKIDDDSSVSIYSGRYHINSKNTTKNLSSSEYIDFSLKEMREFRLNRLKLFKK